MEIKQIIPAPEGFAIRRRLEYRKEESWYDKIVCLAIIKEGNDERIVAVTLEDCGKDFNGSFSALAPNGEHVNTTLVDLKRD